MEGKNVCEGKGIGGNIALVFLLLNTMRFLIFLNAFLSFFFFSSSIRNVFVWLPHGMA